MASNQQTAGEKVSELYQGAKDSAAQAADQTNAAVTESGKRVHQTGKEGREHLHNRDHAHAGAHRTGNEVKEHARDGAHRAAATAQDAAGAAKENTAAEKASQAAKDTAGKTADESKSTFQVVKEKVGLA